jgi:hypothetical protein
LDPVVILGSAAGTGYQLIHRAKLTFVSFLLTALAVGVPAAAAPVKSVRTVTLKPIADALVTSAYPNRNFGRSRVLGLDSRPTVRSYLRFRLRSSDVPVRQATLRIFATVVRGRGLRVVSTRPGSWKETTITFSKAPLLRRTVASTQAPGKGWIDLNVTTAFRRAGLVDLALVSASPSGTIALASRESGAHSPRLIVTSGPDPVLAAAGNVACDPAWRQFNAGNGVADDCRDRDTAALLDGMLAGVLTLGDAQYECGGPSAYAQSYGRAWGHFKSITHPVPGNHDYANGGGTDCDASGHANGYFGYFGEAAGSFGKSYYSFDVGAWHIIALDTECAPVGGCGPGSPEEKWLRDDLAAHSNRCTLAYWHYPIFSSGIQGGTPEATTFWQDLDRAGADVVLNAHEHDYERFALQHLGAKAAPDGIREFVVGTGGRALHPFAAALPNSQVRNDNTWGILKLTLHRASYDWRFVPTAEGSFTDSGSARCH